MPGFDHIAVERRGRVYIVRINRPEVLNAVSYDTTIELHAAWAEFREDSDLWVGILTGTGERAFSVGADLKARAKTGVMGHVEQAKLPFGGITGAPDTWKPIIAAINGYALGGGLEMVLACDLRLAVPHAELGLPEVRWGLIAGGGGVVRLPRLLPVAKAMEVVLMDRRLTADEALQYGLVNAVVPAPELMGTAIAWAERICELGPLAVRASKELMLRSLDQPLPEALVLGRDFIRSVAASEDATEGVRAFTEKRKPNFRGR